MKKTLIVIMVLAIGLTMAQFASAGDLITQVERRNSGNDAPAIDGPLAEDSLCFVDRTHEYNVLPAGPTALDYVKTANNDKGDGDVEYDIHYSAATTTLLLILDNRLGYGSTSGGDPDVNPDLVAAGMTWVTDLGFADTGLNIGIDEDGDDSIDQYSSIYYLDVAGGGMVTLLAQNDGGGRNMYGVAAIPEPMTLTLLGLGGLGLMRRRRR